MDISAAALPFIILAAAIEPSTQAFLRRSHTTPIPVPTTFDTGIRERNHTIRPHSDKCSPAACPPLPNGCCVFYFREMRHCKFMIDYVTRLHGCMTPAVVFKTKEELEVCAMYTSKTVKQCMEHLDSIRKPDKPGDEEEED